MRKLFVECSWSVSATLALALAGVALSACGGAKSGTLESLPTKEVGSCVYVNKFSKGPECRDYLGEWTAAAAASDCAGQGSTVRLGEACGDEPRLGQCLLQKGTDYTLITMLGTDTSKCGSSKTGCELFGGGTFFPDGVCGGAGVDTSAGTGLPVFQEPVLTCVAPKAGEPAGKSPEGKVCTWELISGATEPGRAFSEYASCDRVRTQRPYYPVPAAPDAGRDDPRLADPAYAAEVTWLKAEIRATACGCCHSTQAPQGPSTWYVDQPTGNFVNGFSNRGIAMGAGYVDTVGFGAFAPEQNNGFLRATPEHPDRPIFVTTDPERVRRFFVAEAQARGITAADWAGDGHFGAGPLDAQRFFRPDACAGGEGVAADGTVTWSGGSARYLYVLEVDAQSPTVPPNLDLPRGTLWKIDVPWDGAPVKSGEVRYGQVPSGFRQKAPESGAPPALASGTRYYLYVLQDIAVPVTRCLFTMP